MNKKQKIALIVGGIVLAIVLLATPRYKQFQGVKINANYTSATLDKIASQYDYRAAIIRGAAVVALTFSAYIALKSKD